MRPFAFALLASLGVLHIPLQAHGQAHDLPEPLVRYSFDDGAGSGSAVADESGNGHAGALVAGDRGPVLGEPGLFGEAVRVYGSNEPRGLVRVDASAIPSGSAARTIALWFKQATEAGRDMLFGYGAAEIGRSINLGLEGGGVRLRHWGGNVTYGSGLDFAGTGAGWHHVVLRVNDGARTFADVDVFLDGVRLEPQPGGATGVALDTAGGAFGIGNSLTPRTAAGFDGWIDEFQAWGSALTSAQIARLAEAPPMPAIVRFEATPQNRVPSGSAVTLRWAAEDVTRLTLDPGGIDVTGREAIEVTPTERTTYTLTGTDGEHPAVSESVTLNVGDEPYPNVIVFFLDDFGWSDWEQNGAASGSVFHETPHMNRLAAEGLYFPNGYASAPVCSPTRAALMTGQSPAYNKVSDWISGSGDRGRPVREAEWVARLDPSIPSFASVMSDWGYRTLHIGKWHLGSGADPAANPMNHGFRFNVGGNQYGTPPGPERYFASVNGFSGLPNMGPDIAPEGSYLTDVLTEQAVEQIRRAAADDAAFVMYLAHFAVHTPIQAPAETVARYQAKLDNQPGMDWRGHTNPTYAAMVEHVDRSLGAIVATLEDPDGDPATNDSIAGNTLIVFTADNGGLMGVTSNRPLRGGKGQNYEGGIREPWVFWRPGVIEPGINEEPIASHDLFPTLLGQVGLEAPAGHVFNGQDLSPLLAGEAFEREQPLVFHYPHWSPQGGSPYSALRDGDWKLIYDYAAEAWELYHLADDPGESTNLIRRDLDRAAVLTQALADGLESLRANYPRDVETLAEEPPAPLVRP